MESRIEEEALREIEKGVGEEVYSGDEHVYNGIQVIGIVDITTVDVGNNNSIGEKAVNGCTTTDRED